MIITSVIFIFVIISGSDSRYLQGTEDIKQQIDQIVNIKCFWINGFNLYELWGLRKTEKDE
jgi:hypothetical protein